MNTLKILIILGSTRQGRQGEKVASWIYDIAKSHGEIEVELADLGQWRLPIFDSPIPPSRSKGNYADDTVQRWSQKISKSDGFIIVTPEYNHGYPAVLKNAIDHLYTEWNEKPVAFVGYSTGQSGGIRAVEQLRQVVIELQMMPLRESIFIPSLQRVFDENGQMNDETILPKAERMIKELNRWMSILKEVRSSGSEKRIPLK